MEMEMLQGTYLPACYDLTQYRSLTFVLQTLYDEGDTSLLVPVLPEYDLMHLPALAYQHHTNFLDFFFVQTPCMSFRLCTRDE
jgi:hypothetical protein